MWILPLVGYLGSIVGFCFLTLAIGEPAFPFPVSRFQTGMLCLIASNPRNAASGLYYLSELVEEHTVMAKRFLTRLIYSIVGLQLVLCLIDGFPFWQTALGIFSHVVYLGNMRRFPYVQLSDPLFILSCGRPIIPPPPLSCIRACADASATRQSWF